MKNNMGTTDRKLRIAIALLIGVLYFLNIISGTVAIVLGIVATVMMLTSFIRFCPLYWPFKISTIKKQN